MGTRAQILTAMYDHLATLTFTPALMIATPNVAFPPAPESAVPGNFLSTSLLMNRGEDYAFEGPQTVLGIYQVSVYWEKGVGLVKPLNVVDQIIVHFRDEVLITDNVRITVSEEPWAATPLIEDDRIQIPVSINFTAETEV